jgi:hypothetical protein
MLPAICLEGPAALGKNRWERRTIMRMKKKIWVSFLIGIFAFMLLPAISVRNQAQASTATNINKLIRAVRKANSSVKVTLKSEKAECSISLLSSSKIQFQVQIKTDNTIAIAQMVFSKNSKYVTPVTVIAVDRDKDGKYDSRIYFTKKVKISKIVKGKLIGLQYYQKASTVKDSTGTAQRLSETVFSGGMALWNVMIYKLAGVHFKQIGFTKYL